MIESDLSRAIYLREVFCVCAADLATTHKRINQTHWLRDGRCCLITNWLCEMRQLAAVLTERNVGSE